MAFDERIHRFVWEASGNPYLIATLERYFTLSLRVWYLVLDRVPGLGHAVHDQVQLLEALIDRNGPRARTIMREHVLAFQREIMAAFTATPSGGTGHRDIHPSVHRRRVADARSGATIEATSPATGESLGAVAQGDREDARRAVAAAKAAFPAWAAATAFERAAALRRVADVCERRRDELARVLTLDQGKPLYGEAYDEVDELVAMLRGAAEDGIRIEGVDRAERDPGRARAADAPPQGPDRDRHAVELAVHDARRARRARARGRQHRRLEPGAEHRRVLGPAGRVHRRGRPPARRLQLRPRRGPGGRRRDRLATPTSPPSASSAPPRPAAGSPSAPPARRSCWRWAATARWSCSTTPTSTPPPTRRSPPASCAPASPAPRASGSSSHEAVREDFVERLAARTAAAAQLGDPLAEGTQMGPLNNDGVAAKMDEHVRDAIARGAEVVSGGERAGGFPTDLYWPATILDGVPADADAAVHETFGPIAPVVAIGRSRRRSSSPTPRPTGCWRRSSPPTCARACGSPTRSAAGW